MTKQQFQLAYVQARKTVTGYRLYWVGTRNEIFPGETFKTAGIARGYFKVMQIKGLI